jgi:hypothetical protein
MTTTTSPLDRMQIAKPCDAKWEEMTGDERMRRCALCKLDVYDLSQMTRADAETLLVERTGRTCVRLWRRADGTVITADCPVGVRAAWRRVRWAAAALLAAGVAAAAMFVPRGADAGPARVVRTFIENHVAPPTERPPVMGDFVEPTHRLMGEATVAPNAPEMGKIAAPSPSK